VRGDASNVRAVVGVAVAAALATVGCGSGNGNHPMGHALSQQPASQVESGSPSPSGNASSPAASGTSPRARPGMLTTGLAAVQISGRVGASLDLPRLVSGVVAPGRVVALIWADSAGNTFGIGGAAFPGTRRTSTTLVVSLALAREPAFTAASAGGECTVTLTTASPRRVEGRATCSRLPVGGGSVNLRAKFSAAP
jgi:hypothetical protein